MYFSGTNLYKLRKILTKASDPKLKLCLKLGSKKGKLVNIIYILCHPKGNTRQILKDLKIISLYNYPTLNFSFLFH